MRIAVHHNLPSGGGKRALFEYVKRLKKDGHEVDLHIFNTTDESFLNLKEVVNKVYVYKLFKLSNSLFFLKYFNFILSFFDLFFLAHTSKKMAHGIENRKYDFVFVTNCQFTQNPFILRYLKSKSVLYSQEPYRLAYEYGLSKLVYPDTLMFKIYNLLFSPLGLVIKSIDRYNLRQADLVLVNSYFSRESFARAYGINPVVLYLGVDEKKFCVMNMAKKNIILSVGALPKVKGHDFVLDSLATIDQAIRPKMIIISNSKKNSDEKEYYLQKAKSYGIELEIKTGISDEDLVNYYNTALFTVYASHMEPFGLVLLESMACGTPVVGVKEGGIREVIRDGYNGRLIDRNQKDFSLAICDLILNKEKVKKFAINSRNFIENKFTWDKSYNSLLEVIYSFINKDNEKSCNITRR